MPDMDCLQSHQKIDKRLIIHNDKVTMFQWGILWAKQVENLLDKQFLRARQVVFFLQHQSLKITHTNQFARFPSARRRRHGQTQVNVLTWPTRGLTEGVAGPHWGRQPYFRTRIPSAWNPPKKLQGGSNRIPKNALIPALKNSTRRSARLNHVPTQIWNPSNTNFPPNHKNAHNCKHIYPNNMGMPMYSKPTRTFLRKHGNWHSKSRCGIKTPWSHMKMVCKYTHCQTCKHQTYFHDETWNCDCVVSNMWVPTFAYALFGTQWGTDLRHVKKIAKNKRTNPPKGMFRVNQRMPMPATKVCRALPWEPSLGSTISLQCHLTWRLPANPKLQ